MSIDLYVELPRPVPLRPLLPKAGAVLAEMLGLASAPELTLQALEKGRRVEVEDDELREGVKRPLFLVSIAGEDETVDLMVPSTNVSLNMGSMRSHLEYALGAALAIALAREAGQNTIGDDWRKYSDQVQISPDELLQRLKVPAGEGDYHSAAERLGRKMVWDVDEESG